MNMWTRDTYPRILRQRRSIGGANHQRCIEAGILDGLGGSEEPVCPPPVSEAEQRDAEPHLQPPPRVPGLSPLLLSLGR